MSGSLWQYGRDEPALVNSNDVDFPAANNNSASFTFKQKITRKTEADNTKDVDTILLLKYLIKFWRTLKMSLINCEINLNLTWPY